jgi:hypothetical protein
MMVRCSGSIPTIHLTLGQLPRQVNMWRPPPPLGCIYQPHCRAPLGAWVYPAASRRRAVSGRATSGHQGLRALIIFPRGWGDRRWPRRSSRPPSTRSRRASRHLTPGDCQDHRPPGRTRTGGSGVDPGRVLPLGHQRASRLRVPRLARPSRHGRVSASPGPALTGCRRPPRRAVIVCNATLVPGGSLPTRLRRPWGAPDCGRKAVRSFGGPFGPANAPPPDA